MRGPDRVRTARARGVRVALVAIAIAGIGSVSPRDARAGDGETVDAARERSLGVKRREAIRKGCAWLAAKQRKGGSFGDDKAIVAVSALSTLALMSAGSGIERGPHGEAVRSGVDYLRNLVPPPPPKEKVRLSGPPPPPYGYFAHPGDIDSRMHGQGFATLALATALASADEDRAADLRRVLQAAVHCVQNSQTATGGWGYDPTRSQEHEGSVTVTIVQGLRAAHDAGIHVDDQVVKLGLGYLRQSQKPDGSFKYSIQQDRSTYALTAAAISSFYLLGQYKGDERDGRRIEAGIGYMKRRLGEQMRSRLWYFYGHFYAAWAAWQTDGQTTIPEGTQRWNDDPFDDDIVRTDRFWGPWHAKVYPTLLDMQRADGSWHDEEDTFSFGDVLPTAFAVLTLAIPDELLPIFQR